MARPRGRAAGSRRQVTWVGPAAQGHVSVATGAKVLVASFTPSSVSMLKTTIIRTRGMVSVRPEATTADLLFNGAFGVCVVNSDAFDAGIASIPGPWDDAGWDGWLVWGSFSYDLGWADNTGFRKVNQEYEVDSKGMRKISDVETLCLVGESHSGAFGINMALRHLFKLA